jgi:2-polyprenyl-3-methyl-5-hydroxy-6-metoxy-1,4-benzoquinol methylase
VDVFSQIALEGRPYLEAAAAAAAHALGLCDALADRSADAATLALRLGCDGRKMRALLDVLALAGWLAREAEGFRVVAMPPREAVVEGGWSRLAEAIRSGRAVDDPLAGEGLARFHEHLVAAGAPAARELAARLVDLGDRVLDAGGGMGGYAAAFLDASPTAQVTLVDRAPVLELARAHLARLGDRARLVAGDAERVTGGPYDVALLANLLHLHDPATCARIVAACAAALRPGGTLVVKDLRVDVDRSGPPAGVLFALNMALYTDGGDVYDAPTLAGWMTAAGLADVRVSSLAAAPDAHVLVARRPLLDHARK